MYGVKCGEYIEVNNHITNKWYLNTILISDFPWITCLRPIIDITRSIPLRKPSPSQLESPEPHYPVVPIEDRLVPSAGSSTTPTNNSTLGHPQNNASQHSAHRMEHKIRGLDQIMHWFDSRGCEPLLAPPPTLWVAWVWGPLYSSITFHTKYSSDVDMECSGELGGCSRKPGSSSPPNASPLVRHNWRTLKFQVNWKLHQSRQNQKLCFTVLACKTPPGMDV